MRVNASRDVAELGGRGPQKLPPHGRVEEQVVHLDGRADRAAARGRLAHDAAGGLDLRRRFGSRACGCAAPAGSPRRSRPAPRRGSPACRRGTGRRPRRFCWWRGWPGPAAVRRSGCRRRCRPPGPSPARPATTETSIRVAPASTAFSINSLTTLAGRSITSPAAILLISDWERRWMGIGGEVRGQRARRFGSTGHSTKWPGDSVSSRGWKNADRDRRKERARLPMHNCKN